MKLWKTTLTKNTNDSRKSQIGQFELYSDKQTVSIAQRFQNLCKNQSEKKLNRNIEQVSKKPLNSDIFQGFQKNSVCEQIIDNPAIDNYDKVLNQQKYEGEQDQSDCKMQNRSIVQEVLQFENNWDESKNIDDNIKLQKLFGIHDCNSVKLKLILLQNQINQLKLMKDSLIKQIFNMNTQINTLFQNQIEQFINKSIPKKQTNQNRQYLLKRIEQLEHKLQNMQSAIQKQIRDKQQLSFKLKQETSKSEQLINSLKNANESLVSQLKRYSQKNRHLIQINQNLEQENFMSLQKNAQMQLEITKRIEDLLSSRHEKHLNMSQSQKKFYEQQVFQLQKHIQVLKNKPIIESKMHSSLQYTKEDQLLYRQNLLVTKQKQLKQGYQEFQKLILETDERMRQINQKQMQLKTLYSTLEQQKLQFKQKQQEHQKQLSYQSEKYEHTLQQPSRSRIQKLKLGNNLNCAESYDFKMRTQEPQMMHLIKQKHSYQHYTPRYSAQRNNSAHQFNSNVISKILNRQNNIDQKRINSQKITYSTIKPQSYFTLSPHLSSNKKSSHKTILSPKQHITKSSKEILRLNQLQNTLIRLKKQIEDQIHQIK